MELHYTKRSAVIFFNCHLKKKTKNKIVSEKIASKHGQSRVGLIHMYTSPRLAFYNSAKGQELLLQTK